MRVVMLSVCNLAAHAQEVRRSFASFEVVNHDVKDGPTYVFSDGYATVDSPIVITVAGRRLADADRSNRVDLQKHWLSINVPDNFKLQYRSLVECGLERKGEYPFCDLYTFVDPVWGQEHDYYIYVGNWP